MCAILARLSAFFLAVALLGGCAASLVATQASPDGFQPDGSYMLSELERRQNCYELTQTIQYHVGEMRTLIGREKQARSKPPSTIRDLFARAVGGRKKPSAEVRAFRRHFAQVTAFNAALKEKGCAPVDVDRLLGPNAAIMREQAPPKAAPAL